MVNTLGFPLKPRKDHPLEANTTSWNCGIFPRTKHKKRKKGREGRKRKEKKEKKEGRKKLTEPASDQSDLLVI